MCVYGVNIKKINLEMINLAIYEVNLLLKCLFLCVVQVVDVLINAVESKMSHFKIKHSRCKEMEILIEGTA